MKARDIIFIVCVLLFFSPFFLIKEVFEFYKSFNHDHAMIMSFIKFALLATLGESIGLRIRTGQYNFKGFGLVPRSIVWGILGLYIKISFIVFATGMPIVVEFLGFNDAILAFNADIFSFAKILVAFSISLGLNLMFAPIFIL